VIRARIKTLPDKQAQVGRELNRRVKARLDAQGIAFPPP
jgi:small-conductance mechanosensitive channel